LGLLAYPGQGAVKSLYASYHAKTRNLVVQKRIEEGKYLLENSAKGQYSEGAIIKKFNNLREGIHEDYV
jgi:hypothetical protein